MARVQCNPVSIYMRPSRAAQAMQTELTDSTHDGSGLAAHSRFFQRLHRRYGADLDLLPPGAPVRATMEATLDALHARGHDTPTALRLLPQLALDRPCLLARQELGARHGAPCGPDGQPVELWIIGMGKLGARELNVSSDIDLIYVYEHDGDTCGTPDGRGRISHHEYFARAVKI